VATSSSKVHGNLAADYLARNGGRAVLVMIDARIVFEPYDNGLGPETATHLHGVTRGFWGLVLVAETSAARPTVPAGPAKSDRQRRPPFPRPRL
jgi:hypothetical protein